MARATARDRFEPDCKEATALVRQMMAIPGRSGDETKILAFITDQLRRAGVPKNAIQNDTAHKKSPLGGAVGNLIVNLPGSAPADRRMFIAHVDTVPLCVGAKPVMRRGRIVSADATTAVGADNRSGAAAILTAALHVVRNKLPHPPLTFVWTVQEEVGLQGAHYIALGKLGRPRLAFNYDGGPSRKLTIGATGAYRMQIEITGVPAHAGVRPEQGASAITMASLAIARLHQDRWLGRIEKDRRCGTSNVGVLRAGEATNVVTPSAHLCAEVRSHDPHFRFVALETFREAFEHAAKSVTTADGRCGSVRVEHRLDYESFRLSEDEPCVKAADAAVRAVGGEPVHAISNGGVDANWLVAHGIPTVTLGAGQENAHTTDEYLDIAEFHSACRGAVRLACAADSSP